jgi:hypothetical protein
MKKLLLTLIIILISNTAKCGEWFTPYRDIDKKAFFAYSVLLLIDWAQTKKGLSEGRTEDNGILEKRPSGSKMDTITGLCLLGTGLAIYALPRGDRFVIEGLVIGLELKAVTHNYRVGVRIGVNF